MAIVLRQAQDERIGDLIAAEAESWIDTPFRWQGRVKGKGCDCKGLVAGVAAACDRPEADSVEALAGDYNDQRPVDARRLKAGLARLFEAVPVDQRRPGDVLLLRLGGKPQHLAICAIPSSDKPDRIIEAMPSGPARVRPGRASAGRIDSVWRWRDLAGDEACL